MKKIKNLSKKQKIFTAVISAVLVVVLVAFWGILAFMQLNKIYTEDYEGYTSTKIIAHRGYSGKYYDSSYEALNAAATNSYFDGIETDIRLTVDGIWVCSHDDNPFVDKNVFISKSKFADIVSLPIDSSNGQKEIDTSVDYKICTYTDYLALLKSCNKVALIEIKGEYTAEELEPMVDLTMRSLYYKNIVFGSFNISNLQIIHDYNKHAKLLAFSNKKIVTLLYTNMGYNVGFNLENANKTTIKRLRDKNHLVFCYTVNKESDIARLKELQVDYAISNYSFE